MRADQLTVPAAGPPLQGSVLLVAAHRRVFFARRLRAHAHRRGLRLVAYDTDDLDPVTAFVDEVHLGPACHAPGYADALARIVEAEGVRALIPWNDRDIRVLDRHRDRLAAAGATLVLPPHDFVEVAGDKQRTWDWADRHGIAQPRRFAGPGDAEYPLVAKPRFGQGGVGVSVVGSPAELAVHPALADPGDWVLHERLVGDEFTVDVVLDGGDVVFAVPRRRLKVRDSEVVTARVELDPAVLAFVSDFAARWDFTGVFNMQVMRGPAGVRLIEVNPRIGGGSDLTIAAGVDLAAVMLEVALDGRVRSRAADVRDGLLMRRYFSNVFTAPGCRPGAPGGTGAGSGLDGTRMPVGAAVLDGSDPSALRDLAGRVRVALDGAPGVVVLTGLPVGSPESAAGDLLTISRAVADVIEQDSVGTLVRQVRDRGTEVGEGTSRYSDSRHGGSLHTDGAQYGLPVPHYVGLFCVRQAPTGGDFEIVPAGAVHRLLLQRAPWAVAELEQAVLFDRRGDFTPPEPPWVVKPVFFRHTGEIGMTYLREYIDAAYAHAGAPPMPARLPAALDALDGVLGEPSLRRRGRLAPGELLLMNNIRNVHGRTAFADDADAPRLLLRVWLARVTDGVDLPEGTRA